MQITFEMNVEELDEQFIQIVKALPKDHRIKITVEPLSNELDLDETAFLESNPRTKRELLEAMNDVEAGKTIHVSLDALEELAQKLEKGEKVDMSKYRPKKSVA
jgi:hypothetical protein